MKKFFFYFISLFFPCVTFFVLDLPGAGLVALGLQSTIIGWPVATIWAFRQTFKYLDESKSTQTGASPQDKNWKRGQRQQQ